MPKEKKTISWMKQKLKRVGVKTFSKEIKCQSFLQKKHRMITEDYKNTQVRQPLF